jgi:hypothetical protein
MGLKIETPEPLCHFFTMIAARRIRLTDNESIYPLPEDTSGIHRLQFILFPMAYLMASSIL